MNKLLFYSFILSIVVGFLVGYFHCYQCGVIWLLADIALALVAIGDYLYRGNKNNDG